MTFIPQVALALALSLFAGGASAEAASAPASRQALPQASPPATPASAAPLALSLQQAQSLAIDRNADLKLAQASLAIAEANVTIAGAPPNPVLGIATSGIGSGAGAGSPWQKRVDTVIGVSQLIERGNKRDLRTEQARHSARASGADLQDVRRQLRVLVAAAYADLMAAQDRLAAARDAWRLLEATLAAAQARRSAGDIAGADVERVRVDVLRVRNDVTAAEAELSRARRTLAVLIGEGAHADSLEAVDRWPVLEEAAVPTGASLAQMIAAVVDARADVRAAMARVEAAEAGTRVAGALRTRDLTVGAQLEHYPQPGDPKSASGNSIGISVQVPLFTRHYFEGEIAASLASLDAAQASLARTRALAEADIGNALGALQGAAERVRRNRDELIVAAEKSARAAEFAYQNGAVGVMDVLDARRTLRATQLDALAALADFSKSLAAWKAATETPDQSDGLAYTARHGASPNSR